MAVAAPDIKSTFYRVRKGKGEGNIKWVTYVSRKIETLSEFTNTLLPSSY